MIDFKIMRQRLTEFDALQDEDEIQTGSVDSIEPCYADAWPAGLDTSIRKVLTSVGIMRPYQHQADAIKQSLDGMDVVLSSPTASGKTVAFTMPMLDTLVRNPDSHALMIYPMKALAFDQRTQIDTFCKPLSIDTFHYDGDTDREVKKLVRESPPHILLTNPENLYMSFLGHRDKWQGFLRNLQYIVIDEMHEYRGFFGSNMALLLRRFFLYLNRIGANPRVFLSTATCANPVEHAQKLTGRDVTLVSANNSARPKRHFLFVNPQVKDYRYREIIQLRIEQAALTALAEELQVLVFCPTKRFLETVCRNTRRKAKKLGIDTDRVAEFYADLKKEYRKDRQQKIKAGEISIVFTTNALELGLDIGCLDGVILAGFPASIMSAWQQIGRAGRGWDKEAFVLFYAMNDPIDKFFVGNLKAFLNKSFDELVIDPSNEELIERHLAMLSAETNGKLHGADKSVLGHAFYDAAIKDGGKAPATKFQPHFDRRFSIRGGIGSSYEIKLNSVEVGQMSETRRFREAYIGAIFPFLGQKYRVHSHEASAVVLCETEQYLRTDPQFYTVLMGRDIFEGYGYGDIEVYYGNIDFVTNFTGFKVIDERTEEVRDTKYDEDARFQNNLHAFWVNIPESKCATVGIGALEHMFRVGSMFVIPVDKFDTNTYSTCSDETATFYYENYPGGIGVAKKLFSAWQTVLKKGIEVANDCKCTLGCQNCIEPAKSYNTSNTDIDKKRGIELAEYLLTAAESPPDRKYQNGRMIPISDDE